MLDLDLRSDIAEFEQGIVNWLILYFKMNKNDAIDAVSHSVLRKILFKYPKTVMHYPIENWANDIWKEYNHLPVEI